MPIAGSPPAALWKGHGPGSLWYLLSAEFSHRRFIKSYKINPAAICFKVGSGQPAVPGEMSNLLQREIALTVRHLIPLWTRISHPQALSMSLPGDVAHMKSGEEHTEKWEPITQSYYRAGVLVFAASPGCAAGWQGQQQGLQIRCPSPYWLFTPVPVLWPSMR